MLSDYYVPVTSLNILHILYNLISIIAFTDIQSVKSISEYFIEKKYWWKMGSQNCVREKWNSKSRSDWITKVIFQWRICVLSDHGGQGTDFYDSLGRKKLKKRTGINWWWLCPNFHKGSESWILKSRFPVDLGPKVRSHSSFVSLDHTY